ncbi:sterol desaturase family protein [Sporosarcina sp. 179-K 3D1 HS]|uniref:sterol desaturase family protein n=1 Tax=Sporosarcina sp. 179-K 3D1 HS TaxID=3232169 RepID=UPI0039A0FF2F
MQKYGKDFILFPDVLVMGVIWIGCTIFTVLHLLQFSTWVAIAFGMLTYATNEYVIHRFLFHMKPPRHPSLLKLLRRLHYDHHVYPDNLKLLFLPLWFSLPGFILYSFIVYGITGNISVTIAFATGLLGHFLFYEWKHYVAHRPITPRTQHGKKIKKHHLLHHFKNENYWFGVTHMTYDKALGTYPDNRSVEKSPTAKNLEKRART